MTVRIKNVWKKIKKPFFALAPMANVTDFAFREMFAKYGKPDLLWTEFVSADGLLSKGREKLLIDFKYSKKQKPIIAQIFSANPKNIGEACALIKKLGFDGIDINMGCPDKAVQRQGSGAKLITNPDLAIQIIKEAKKATGLPISIKTRIGYYKIDLNWIKLLLMQDLPALTVHLRTKKEMSLVPAHWDIMPQIIEMRDKIAPNTLIIGNGDVNSLSQAKELVSKYGCDGIMIGRGAFGQPWFFAENKKSPELKERLKILLEHAKIFDKTFSGIKNFDIMKKHFKAYINGFDGAKELRNKLMETKSLKEMKEILSER